MQQTGPGRHEGTEMHIGRRALIASLLVSLTGAGAARAADFYAGKQITLIVGAPAGGGYDMLGRLVSRHIGKHIPGAPAIIVQNMPAANSVVAMNFLANAAPRDGTTVALVQRGMLLARMINPNGVQFDIAKLNWMGNLNSETGVTLSLANAPVTDANQLFEKELIVGGQTGVDPEMTPRLYNALLGTKFKIISGYEGTTAIGLAMERGEVEGIGDWSWSSLKVQRPEWIRDKKVRVLIQGALEKDPELPDVPSALDLVKDDLSRKALELYFTQKTVARPMVAPPGVPADRIEILSKALVALGADKDFLEDAKRSKLEIGILPGEAVQKVIAMIAAAPPEAVDKLVKAMTQ
jgi:tripartite-type tricarboxylate transporter receptor subunit TctC